MGGIRYVTGDPDRAAVPGRRLARRRARRDVRRAGHPGRAARPAPHRPRPGGRLGHLRGGSGHDGVAASRVGDRRLPARAHRTRCCPTSRRATCTRPRDGDLILIAANQDTVFRAAGAASWASPASPTTSGTRRTAPRRGHGRAGRPHRRVDRDRWTRTNCWHGCTRTACPPAASSGPRTCSPTRISRRARPSSRLAHPEFGELPMQNVFPRLSATPGRVRHGRALRLASTTTRSTARLARPRRQRAGTTDRRGRDLTAVPTFPGGMMSYRLGVDVGGTFTDVLLIDERTGGTWRAKTASTPQDQSVGVLRGHRQGLRPGRHHAADDRPGPARHDGRHERDTRGQGGPRRAGHDRGFPSGAADRPVVRPRRAGRLDHLAQAGTAGLTGEHGRGDRADRRRRRRWCTPLDEDDVRAKLRSLRDGGHRGAGRLADQLLRQRRARAADRANRRRGAPGVPRLAVQRGAARAARVRAHDDHGGQQLRPSAGSAVPGQPGKQARRRGVSARPVHPAQRRRPVDRGRQERRTPVTHAASGPAGGVAGAAWVAEQAGLPRPAHLRHGRHVHRHGAGPEGSAPHRPGDHGRRPHRAGHVGRRADGGRGRRVDRARSRADPGAAGRARSRPARYPGPAAYGKGGTEPTVTDANVVLGLPARLAGGGEITLDGRRRRPRSRRSRTQWAWAASRRRPPASSTSSTRTCSAALRLVSRAAGLRSARLRAGRLRRRRAAARQRARAN